MNCQFSRKRNVHIIELICVSLIAGNTVCKWGEKLQSFPGIATPPRPINCICTDQICLPTTGLAGLAQILPNMQYFPYHWSTYFFLFMREALIFWWVFEEYIIFLIWPAWVLCNFYLKQKQRFLVWSFTENTSFNSFHEGIWSITKVLRNAILNKVTPSITRLFVSLGIHYDNSLNTVVLKQNET